MSENMETVKVELSMLQEDADKLLKAFVNDIPIAATFDHHAEPIRISFGEVDNVIMESREQ